MLKEIGYVYYNPGHNILRHFDVCQNFRVTTNETNRDVSCQTT